ncbi:MAG: hypothetical protein SFU25_03815 [Candidatus Caenarcaniphilales bacterium]|nr:hypothetical protein [Candidatus Caenarcaniphilales bacterium]
MKDLTFFHWTDKDSLLKILQDKKIFSKGTLWGLGKLPNGLPESKKTVKEDSEHGFVDFVFLGNNNWIQLGRKSFYGEYAIEFSSTLLLEDTEFFVFHFNTGYKWPNMKLEDKVSDLSKLITLSGKFGEILVRRKIDISTKSILKIYCPEDDPYIRKALEELDLSENMEIYNKSGNNRSRTLDISNNMEYEVELEYGSFTNNKLEKIDSSQVHVDGDKVLIFDDNSPCVIDLKKRG